jgi:RNA polymerase sigma-70 factor (ECF subfamily)
MTDTLETERDARADGHGMTSRDDDLHAWFIREVLPLEAALTQYLQHNWREPAHVADMLHDIYVRVFDAARKEKPKATTSFVFATARNLLVDRVRHQKIVPFEAVENIEALNIAADAPGPDDQVIAREELRRLQSALEKLHPRSRDAFIMHHVDGLSRREIAQRMGISEITVTWYLNQGVRLLADILYRTPASRMPQR